VDLPQWVSGPLRSFPGAGRLIPKQKTWKSSAYKKFLQGLDCAMCGHAGWDDNQIVVHHAIAIPGLNLGKMGGKANDSFGIPLHVTCHNEFHAHFEKYKEEQPLWLMKTLEMAVRHLAPTR